MNKNRHDIIRGIMFGAAIGDALGAPVEFMSKEEIAKKHGRVTDMIGGGWLNVNPGEVTDDTQMTICVAWGIVENPDDPIKAIGEDFIRWFDSNPKDIGCTCGKAIAYAKHFGIQNNRTPTREDWNAAAKHTHEYLGGKSAGNGSLMRTSFIPCYYNDLEQVVNIAKDVSKMTHYDDMASEYCALYCRFIAESRELETQKERINHFEKFMRNRHNIKILNSNFTPSPTGYVVDSYEAAVWSVYRAIYSSSKNPFQFALEEAVNLGGDSDTIGAITGALAGGIFGAKKIPKKWADKLEAEAKRDIEVLSGVATLRLEAASIDKPQSE